MVGVEEGLANQIPIPVQLLEFLSRGVDVDVAKIFDTVLLVLVQNLIFVII